MEMSFDEAVAGTFIGEAVHELSPEMVGAFCRATGRSEAVVGIGEIAPAGLLTLLSTAPFREKTGRRSGDIHARHRFEQISALRVGDTVRTTSHVMDKFDKRGRKFLVYTSQTEVLVTRRLVARCEVTLAVIR